MEASVAGYGSIHQFPRTLDPFGAYSSPEAHGWRHRSQDKGSIHQFPRTLDPFGVYSSPEADGWRHRADADFVDAKLFL